MAIIDHLRERKAASAIEARRLLDAHKGADFTAEHLKQYDDLTAEIVALDDRIKTEQDRLDKIADEEFSDVENFRGKDRIKDKSPAAKIFDTWMRKNKQDLSAEEHAAIRNTMSTTTGSQGGYTVVKEVGDRIVEQLKKFGGMRELATSFTTSRGNPIAYPTSDGTLEEGEWMPENASGTNLDIDFGTVDLNTYKVGTKVIAVPIELLEDSEFDLEAFINARMITRIGRTSNKGYTTGVGTTQPWGAVTRASLGKVGATGQTVTVLYNDLVDLYESVDESYIESGKAKYMFHQQVRKQLRKLVDGQGRPIWSPGYEFGISKGISDELLGAQVKINNDMPTPAANAKSVLFGDFSPYIIRDVNQIVMYRFEDSNFLTKGQVGFMGWTRTGGNLTDVNAVKYYQNSAT